MMSTMIENYDSHMVDYTTDIDMQMYASSSDLWLLDEAKMEEDAPGLKHESITQLKPDVQDQGDLTIEIDMDEHNSAEYDMVEDIHHGSTTDILDVEVYDASLVHSPAMVALDSSLPAETLPIIPLTHPDIAEVAEHAAEGHVSSVNSIIESAFSSSPKEVAALVAAAEDLSHTNGIPGAHSSFPPSAPQDDVNHLLPQVIPSEEPTPANTKNQPSHGGTTPETEECSPEEEVTENVEPGLNTVSEEVVTTDEDASQNRAEDPESDHANVESNSSGDPHEISEGVYIDPPPPVLLSLVPEDVDFQYCFFNEPPEWKSSSTIFQERHFTLLHHLPTLYYESLSSLFDALRQDEVVQTTVRPGDAELVLQAVDLVLTISEDNIYAREVSLHDLNMLHDASGISGPLRMRLYLSTPRFIVRYQHLQEHVSRLQLELPSRETPARNQTEIQDNQQPIPSSVTQSIDHKEASTENSHSRVVSTAADAVAEVKGRIAERLAEEISPETHLPRQILQEEGRDVTSAESKQDHHEEGKDSHAVDGEDGSLATPYSDERDDDAHYDGDETTSTVTHPALQDEGHDNDSSDGDAAVIGLDVLEADAGEYTNDKPDNTSEHQHGLLEEADDEYANGGQDPERGFENADTTERAVFVEVEHNDNGEEQGDDVVYEHSEYAEDEAETESIPAPDHFQPFLQPSAQIFEGDIKNRDDSTHHEDKEDIQEQVESAEDEVLPELPTDPISFDDGNWNQDFEEYHTANGSWVDELGDDHEKDNSTSNHSSVTLSSGASKRTYDEYDSGGGEYDEDEGEIWDPPGSPDPKRSRTE